MFVKHVVQLLGHYMYSIYLLFIHITDIKVEQGRYRTDACVTPVKTTLLGLYIFINNGLI